MTNNKKSDEKLKYPVTFTPKVVVKADTSKKEIHNSIEKIGKQLNLAIKITHSKHSSGGKYYSETMHVTIPDEETMRKLYSALKEIDGVVMTL